MNVYNSATCTYVQIAILIQEIYHNAWSNVITWITSEVSRQGVFPEHSPEERLWEFSPLNIATLCLPNSMLTPHLLNFISCLMPYNSALCLTYLSFHMQAQLYKQHSYRITFSRVKWHPRNWTVPNRQLLPVAISATSKWCDEHFICYINKGDFRVGCSQQCLWRFKYACMLYCDCVSGYNTCKDHSAFIFRVMQYKTCLLK